MLHDSKTPQATALLGTAGEQAVGNWLYKQGFIVLCYNFRSRGGEVDVIAQRNKLICFVEVKVRTTDYFNSSGLITASKQKKIIHTARLYCLKNRITDSILRFDVALVKPIENRFDINYIPNAFSIESMNNTL